MMTKEMFKNAGNWPGGQLEQHKPLQIHIAKNWKGDLNGKSNAGGNTG